MKKVFYFRFLAALFLLGCSSNHNDPINPKERPDTEDIYRLPEALEEYYEGVNLNLEGEELYDELAVHTIAKHTPFLEYTQRHTYLYKADADPKNPDNVILIYSGESRDKREYESGNNTYHTQTFNTEHIYPRSYLENEAEADLHVLRVADIEVNSLRLNYPFTDGSGKYALKGEAFYPGDEWKGDVARVIMYMNLRYDESIEDMGGLELFLDWNAEDPVSALEKQRNNIIEGAQGNRNPFIDNPHLATRIWGGEEANNRWDGTWENDTEAPDAPGALTIEEVTFETVTLSWVAATDNVGVAKYNIIVDGDFYAAVSSTTATVEELQPGVTYEFTVTAADAAGNVSDAADSVEATTTADNEAPSVPQSLSASNIGVTSVTLSWEASTDNAGVAGYDIFINGKFYKTVASTEYTIAGLSELTTYSFAVAARDLYDNVSESSTSVKITTGEATGETGSKDLIISEYIEGQFGHNKALEIGNPTGEAIDLSSYSIMKITNAETAWKNEYQLKGNLAAGEVLVLAHEDAEYPGILNTADILLNHQVVNFNGNDPIGLFKDGELIDMLGTVGGADFAANVNLRRKTNIKTPNPVFTPDEWESYEHDNTQGLGKL